MLDEEKSLRQRRAFEARLDEFVPKALHAQLLAPVRSNSPLQKPAKRIDHSLLEDTIPLSEALAAIKDDIAVGDKVDPDCEL